MPAGVTVAVVGALMLLNTLYLWAELLIPAPDAGWSMALMLGLNLPAITEVSLPIAAFYLGLGAMLALARETAPATRRRLAPRVVALLGLVGIVGAGATFMAQDYVVTPANRGIVALAVSKLDLKVAGGPSPQELTFDELRARMAARDRSGTLAVVRLAKGLKLTPGEANQQDRRALGLKAAIPATVATLTWSGLAWGAAFGLSRVPAFVTGGVTLVAGLLLANSLSAYGWPPGWATIAGSLLPLALALPWLWKRRP